LARTLYYIDRCAIRPVTGQEATKESRRQAWRSRTCVRRHRKFPPGDTRNYPPSLARRSSLETKHIEVNPVCRSGCRGQEMMEPDFTIIPSCHLALIENLKRSELTPTLEASLKTAVQSRASLTQPLTGVLSDGVCPQPEQQLVPKLPHPQPRATQRELDGNETQSRLREFLLLSTQISVLEAGRRLNMEARELYLRTN